MNQYNVLIIGAGKIGALFDTPSSLEILTHAHAFSKHPGFNLLGFYDINQTAAKEAAKIWKTKFFISLTDAFSQNKIDIAVVAVPDKYHEEILNQIAGYPLKLVFTEKPLTISVDSAKKIIQLYNKKNIPLLVNYSRRFIPELINIKQEITNHVYGEFLNGFGLYGKGLLHNGSHLIDLLRFFLGEVSLSKIVKTENDCYKDDPSVSAILNINKNPVFLLQYINCNLYTIFEVDLMFEKARIRITNSGFNIEKHLIKESPVFKSYYNMVKQEEIKTSFDQALYHSADHIYNVLENNAKLLCSGKEALEALKICTI